MDKRIRGMIFAFMTVLIGVLFYPQVTAVVDDVTVCQEWENVTEEVTNEVHQVEALPQIITVANSNNVEDSEEIRVYDEEENEYVLEEGVHYNVISYEGGEYEIFELP